MFRHYSCKIGQLTCFLLLASDHKFLVYFSTCSTVLEKIWLDIYSCWNSSFRTEFKNHLLFHYHGQKSGLFSEAHLFFEGYGTYNMSYPQQFNQETMANISSICPHLPLKQVARCLMKEQKDAKTLAGGVVLSSSLAQSSCGRNLLMGLGADTERKGWSGSGQGDTHFPSFATRLPVPCWRRPRGACSWAVCLWYTWMGSKRSLNAGCHPSGPGAPDLQDSPCILQDQRKLGRFAGSLGGGGQEVERGRKKSETSAALNSSSEQALSLVSDHGWGPGFFLLSPLSISPSSLLSPIVRHCQLLWCGIRQPQAGRPWHLGIYSVLGAWAQALETPKHGPPRWC